MQYHKSPLGKWKKRFLGIYYDYRKTTAVFCCYSLLGTCLILSASPAQKETGIFYRLSSQNGEDAKEQGEALAAEASSTTKKTLNTAIHKITSHTVAYSLTGTISGSGKEAAPDTSKLSQKEAQKSAADTAEQKEKKESTSKKSSGVKKNIRTDYDISAFSDDEIHILERIVEAEAGDQPLKGRIMVAHVVLNRVASEEFPDTIETVVFQNNSSTYQFSPVKDGRYYEVTVSKKTKKAVAKAFQSKDLTDGALYFMSRSGSSKKNIKWFDSALTKITSYGCHEFFR